MGPSYSLDYYDRIFGSLSPAYRELLQALADELEDYAACLAPVLSSADPQALSRLRHSHRPLVENLKLEGLRCLEERVQTALETGAPAPVLAEAAAQLEAEARSLAGLLISEQSRAGREPR